MQSHVAASRLTYLDGLRGWMALIVLLSHLFAAWLFSPPQLTAVHGEPVLALIRWTPLGPLLDGVQAVYVFFFISGLAISYPILRSSTPGRTLWTMAVYRYPRLTVPILASCLAAFVLLAAGAFANAGVARHGVDPWFASLYEFSPDFGRMLSFSFWGLYGHVPTAASWSPVLWTMRVELFGSFCLFLLLAVVPWRWLRVAIALGPAGYWAASTDFGYFLGFFVGYALGELLVVAERSPFVRRQLAEARSAGWLYLLVALFLSIHQQNVAFQQNRDVYTYEINLIAGLTLGGVILSPTVQRWLSSRLSRFLGRISFGLYLTHLLVICSFSSALFNAIADRLPYWAVVCIVAGLTLPLAIGVGYLFTIVVEEYLLRRVKTPIVAASNAVFDIAVAHVRGIAARFGAGI